MWWMMNQLSQKVKLSGDDTHMDINYVSNGKYCHLSSIRLSDWNQFFLVSAFEDTLSCVVELHIFQHTYLALKKLSWSHALPFVDSSFSQIRHDLGDLKKMVFIKMSRSRSYLRETGVRTG